MNVEEALFILDSLLQQKFLNNVQELVFRQAWAGQTYPEMAESSGYNAHYIKDVGYKLWKLLSKALEEEVTKSNFRSVLRRRYFASQHAWSSLSVSEGETRNHIFERESLSDWTGDSVSVPAGVSEASGEEIASPKDIASGQEIGESQQTPVVNTVLAASLDVDAKGTTANPPRGQGELQPSSPCPPILLPRALIGKRRLMYQLPNLWAFENGSGLFGT